MKVYFINLDRSPERRAWFESQAEALGLDVVRVPAVDGKTLTDAELAHWRERSVGGHGPVLSPGEVGCFLSHRRVWENVIADDEEWVFIAEDDIHFARDATALLANSDWIPQQADLIKAETDLKRHEFSAQAWPALAGFELRQLNSMHLGSGGYFMRRQAASHLLAVTAERCEVIDGILFETVNMKQHGLQVMQALPAVCIQDVYVDQHADSAALSSVIHRAVATLYSTQAMICDESAATRLSPTQSPPAPRP